MKESYDELILLHTALKEIVRDFESICNRAGVSFYLFYGTLLGAARHQDIIPWDDDIDLAMMRDEYEKLIMYFRECSEPGYQLYCAETSDKHTQIFAKLVRTDGKYDSLAKYYTHQKGLSIDVFPLDEARPQSNMFQAIRGKRIVHLRRIVNSRAKLKDPTFKENPMRHFARWLTVLPYSFINNHKLLLHINMLCKKSNGKGYSNIISYSTTDKLYKENVRKEEWVPSKRLPLGNATYQVPGQYSTVLTYLYGSNWNDIPPVSLRTAHTHLITDEFKKEG